MRSNWKPVAGSVLALLAAAVAAAEPPAKKALPVAEMTLLVQTMQLLRESYVTPLSDEELVLAAMRGMLREVDPEGGEYFSPEALKDMAPPPAGTGAIGLELQMRKEMVVIVPLAGSPAERAGILSGDVLSKVDGVPMKGRSLREASLALRGPLSSKVEIEVFREGGPSPQRFVIERQRVRIPALSLSRPRPDVLVLKVPYLTESTLPELAREASAEWQRQPFAGIVLDLRRNSGGLLEGAFGLAAFFLPADSVIAKMSGRMPQGDLVFRASPSHYLRGGSDPLPKVPQALRDLPLVVVIDEMTAAGAEIVTAALRDYKRATVVGRRSFGRASVQTQTKLDSGAAKFTTAFWESPSGARIHHVGITPDHVVEQRDPQAELDAAIARLPLRK
jgi:carboxyl-terminal processing protease